MVSDSDSDTEFSMKPFRKILAAMFHELTDAIDSTKITYKLVKKSKNEYTLKHPLTPRASQMTGLESMSLQDVLEKLLPAWKSEGRLGPSGRTVRLGKEAIILGLEQEVIVDIYEVCSRITSLFGR